MRFFLKNRLKCFSARKIEAARVVRAAEAAETVRNILSKINKTLPPKF